MTPPSSPPVASRIDPDAAPSASAAGVAMSTPPVLPVATRRCEGPRCRRRRCRRRPPRCRRRRPRRCPRPRPIPRPAPGCRRRRRRRRPRRSAAAGALEAPKPAHCHARRGALYVGGAYLGARPVAGEPREFHQWQGALGTGVVVLELGLGLVAREEHQRRGLGRYARAAPAPSSAA